MPWYVWLVLVYLGIGFLHAVFVIILMMKAGADGDFGEPEDDAVMLILIIFAWPRVTTNLFRSQPKRR